MLVRFTTRVSPKQEESKADTHQREREREKKKEKEKKDTNAKPAGEEL